MFYMYVKSMMALNNKRNFNNHFQKGLHWYHCTPLYGFGCTMLLISDGVIITVDYLMETRMSRGIEPNRAHSWQQWHGTISVPSILLCDNSRIKGFERDSRHVVTFRTVTLPITYCTRLGGPVAMHCGVGSEQRSDDRDKDGSSLLKWQYEKIHKCYYITLDLKRQHHKNWFYTLNFSFLR